MNHLSYPLIQNQTMNRWLVAGPFEQEKSFKRISMNVSGDLNRWLTEGFAVFENPSRKEFIEIEEKVEKEKINSSDVSPGNLLNYVSSEKEWQLYFPWKNKKVEMSGFWQQPTHLQSWAVTSIRSAKETKATFRLFTCGSVVLWVNDEKIIRFSPYTRNEEKSIQFEVMLQEGENTFLVLFEDLAERDTLYYFRMDYLGTDPLNIELPVGETDPKDVYLLEDSLNKAYFSSDVIKNGDVVLNFENPLPEELELVSSFKVEWWSKNNVIPTRVPPGSTEVKLGNIEDIAMGNVLLTILLKYHNFVIPKNMFLQVHPENVVPVDVVGNIQSRKEQALSFISKHGNNDMHRAYSLAKYGVEIELVESIVRETLNVINSRFDCSDFYFNQLFRFWIEFRESDLFGEQLWEDCKQAILNYRYWFDEPGDDVMWFFSENHALLFHTCEYLAGQLFPNENFTNAGITGSEHKEKARQRLQEWFTKFTEEGLAEWNSSAYIPINAMGFLQVYDLVEDHELKAAAKKALDTTFRLMALNSHNGYLSCSHGRIYEKELKGNYNNATTSLLWIAYGVGNLNNATFATTSFSVSEYVPPDYQSFIHLKPDDNIIFKHHQGPEGFVDLYTFKNHYGLLSSAVAYRPTMKGYSEHVIHSTLSPEAIVWINHPGEETELGTGRPSFWAGNGILPKVDQYQDLAIVHYRIEQKNEVAYTHAYFPVTSFEEVEIGDKWCFGKLGDSFVAIYAQNGIELQDQGQNQNRELISYGRSNSWIIRNSSVKQFTSFAEFVGIMKDAEIKENTNEIMFNDPVHGMIQSSYTDDSLKVNGSVEPHVEQQTEGVLEKW